jgi:hypothetical protein
MIRAPKTRSHRSCRPRVRTAQSLHSPDSLAKDHGLAPLEPDFRADGRLLAEVEAKMKLLSSVELVNEAADKPLLESWRAAILGRALGVDSHRRPALSGLSSLLLGELCQDD